VHSDRRRGNVHSANGRREVLEPVVARYRSRKPKLYFRANAVRLQLHTRADNLANFLRTLTLPAAVPHWSLTSLREKLIKIGARVVQHGRAIVFRMAEVGVPRLPFAEILHLIDGLRARPAPS